MSAPGDLDFHRHAAAQFQPFARHLLLIEGNARGVKGLAGCLVGQLVSGEIGNFAFDLRGSGIVESDKAQPRLLARFHLVNVARGNPSLDNQKLVIRRDLKIICERNSRKVLGVHIIGEGASELIHIG